MFGRKKLEQKIKALEEDRNRLDKEAREARNENREVQSRAEKYVRDSIEEARINREAKYFILDVSLRTFFGKDFDRFLRDQNELYNFIKEQEIKKEKFMEKKEMEKIKLENATLKGANTIYQGEHEILSNLS